MKTKQQVEEEIKRIKRDYSCLLNGSVATVEINAPRALMQLAAESKLNTLHWILGTTYKSKLKGVNT